MTFLHSAARLNNEGTRCLLAGDENAAFTAFKAALEKISQGDRSRVQDEPVVTPLCIPRPPSSPPMLYPSRQSLSGHYYHYCNSSKYQQQLPPSTDEETHHKMPSSSTNPFLYEEALLFREGQQLVPSDAPYCSAVIIYNMALAFHHRTVNNNSKNNSTLGKALFLYTICLRHIQAADSEIYSYSDVVVAAVNNQAHIYYSQKQMDKGRTVLGELWAVLRQVQSKAQPVVSAFEDSDMDGFVQNVLLLLHESSLAPAA